MLPASESFPRAWRPTPGNGWPASLLELDSRCSSSNVAREFQSDGPDLSKNHYNAAVVSVDGLSEEMTRRFAAGWKAAEDEPR